MSEKKRKRKEKLSIYLVRDPNKIESEIINTENAMQPIDIELPDIESARLYIKNIHLKTYHHGRDCLPIIPL